MTGSSFATDRLNSQYSALYLNNQYLQVPGGIYFNGDFTVTVWVKPFRQAYADRVIDFGNGASSDNLLFGISNGGTPYAGVYDCRLFINCSHQLNFCMFKKNLNKRNMQQSHLQYQFGH
jgi:hypothetical protein